MTRCLFKSVLNFWLGFFFNIVFLISQVLTGHTGSVLCLQYDDKVIISGSSDSTVRVWDVATGEMVNTLIHHCEAVLHLRFCNGMMVTCSKVRNNYYSLFYTVIMESTNSDLDFFLCPRIVLLLFGT